MPACAAQGRSVIGHIYLIYSSQAPVAGESMLELIIDWMCDGRNLFSMALFKGGGGGEIVIDCLYARLRAPADLPSYDGRFHLRRQWMSWKSEHLCTIFFLAKTLQLPSRRWMMLLSKFWIILAGSLSARISNSGLASVRHVGQLHNFAQPSSNNQFSRPLDFLFSTTSHLLA